MLLAESKHLENCPLQEQSALLIIHLLLYPGAPYAGTVETDSMHFLQEAAPPFPVKNTVKAYIFHFSRIFSRSSGRTRSSIYIIARSVFERSPVIVCSIFRRGSRILLLISAVFIRIFSVKLSFGPRITISCCVSPTPLDGYFFVDNIIAFLQPSNKRRVLPDKISVKIFSKVSSSFQSTVSIT